VGSKLFVTLGLVLLLHFIQRFANDRTRRIKQPVTLGATKTLTVLVLNPSQPTPHGHSIGVAACSVRMGRFECSQLNTFRLLRSSACQSKIAAFGCPPIATTTARALVGVQASPSIACKLLQQAPPKDVRLPGYAAADVAEPLQKASRPALIWSALVAGIPCGKPG